MERVSVRKTHPIIAVVGHVRHGKSTLVRALGGDFAFPSIHEKSRNLAFRAVETSNGTFSLVDLPGHGAYLHKTAGGLWGATGALVVVDAREGLKAQTLEHLRMLSWLGIGPVLPVLSRCDLYAGDWEKRSAQIAAELRENFALDFAAIRTVSLRRPDTIEALKRAMAETFTSRKPQKGDVTFRIDAIYRPKGFGTVITGTMLGGTVARGMRLRLPERGFEIRVKTLQRHGVECDKSSAPSRVALGIGNLKKMPETGDLVTSSRVFNAYDVLEGSLKALPGGHVRHGATVRVVVGPKSVGARIFFYDDSTVRLALETPLAVGFDEPFIVIAEGALAGLGRVLNPVSDPLRSRVKKRLLKLLRQREFASAFTLLADHHPHGLGLGNHRQRFGLCEAELFGVLASCRGYLFDEEKMKLFSPRTIGRLKDELNRFVESHPQAVLGAASLKRRFPWAGAPLCLRVLKDLEEAGRLRREGSFYLSRFYDATDWKRELATVLRKRLEACGERPLSPSLLFEEAGVDTAAGRRALKSLEREGAAVALGEGLWADARVAERMERAMRILSMQKEGLDVRKMKSRFSLSRRQAVAWLEWLDTKGAITKKEQVRFAVEEGTDSRRERSEIPESHPAS